MRASSAHHQQPSPARLLVMLSGRFGAFQALASSGSTRVAPGEELPMEPLVPEAVLEFGEDLGDAAQAVRGRGPGWPAA